MRVLFSAGEASGDLYAAELARAFRAEGLVSPDEAARRLLASCGELARAHVVDRRCVPGGADVASDPQPRFADVLAGVRAWHPEVEAVVAGAETVEGATSALVQAMETGEVPLWDGESYGFSGVGARRMRDAGVRSLADSSTWGAIGIAESLRVAPRVWRGARLLAAELRRGDPGLFVPIDFGALNVRLAREAKARGWRVLYFSPPGSWRRDRQGADLPRVADAIVTPFRWSADILVGMGSDAHCFGHPILEVVARFPEPRRREGVAVLPGSRAHEALRNLDAILPALSGLPGPAHVALAPTIDAHALKEAWRRAGGPGAVWHSDAPAALKAARAAVVCSGTATLEAALCRCPSVVVYRAGWAMAVEFRLRRPRFDHVSLPNILLGRRAVAELLQWDATPQRIAAELRPLLAETPERHAQLAAFAKVEAMLGPSDCFSRTARLARSLTDRSQKS